MSESWGDLAMLRAAAESLTDLIRTRVAAENRALRGGAAADSAVRDRLVAIPRDAEQEGRDFLFALYTDTVPDRIRGWAGGIPGLASGEVFPRLMGLIGDPRIAIPWKWEQADGKRQLVSAGDPYDRSLRQLWQWCGCGDPQKKPESGMSQEQLLACGKRTVVRPLLYAFSSYIARSGRVVTKEGSKKLGMPVSQTVADSRYFRIFAEQKDYGLTRTHEWQCQNHKRPPLHPSGCGTVAHREWGEPGSPWRPGHAEAHAHRIVAKELLRDLWIVAE